MEDITDITVSLLKKLTLPVVVAVVGTIVHLHRTKEKISVIQFLMHTTVNVGIVFTTGIICTDYFEITNERLVWVLSGVACSFSTYILNLIQTIITDIAPEIARKMFGVSSKDEE